MSEKEIELSSVKLCLLGGKATGKTSVCNVFQGLEFNEEPLLTVFFQKTNKIFKLENGKDINVIIYDPSSKERFQTITMQNLRHINGVIIVFDVTDRSSFDIVEGIIKDVETNYAQPSMVLFGNKADKEKSEWKVTDEEVKNLTQKYNLKYFETSAKTNMNIKEGFDYIVTNSLDKIKERNIVINLNNKNDNKQGCVGQKKKK